MAARIFLIISCLWLPFAARADFRFAFDADANQWQLSNGVIAADFQLAPDGTFQFQSLSGLMGQGVWNKANGTSASLIRFTAGGKVYNGESRYRLVRQFTTPVERKGLRQSIVLIDEGARLQITVELTMYESQPVVEHRLSLRNLQPGTVYVQSLDLLPWSFADEMETFRTFRVNQWAVAPVPQNFESFQDILDSGGPPITVQAGSRGVHCAWFAVADHTNRGLFAGLEFDGRADATIQQDAESNALRLSAYITEMNHPLVEEGELTLPTAFVGLYRGDWDEAGFRTQRFSEAAISKPAPDPTIFPYVVWDSWGFGQNLNETILRRNADVAAALGVELFVVDLGWSRMIGDWRDDPQKFPVGMRSISDYVHSLGMKFGMHFALAEAAADSPVLQQHPDWTSSQSYGYFDALSLCLSNADTRDWVTKEAVRIIDDYNVDWILQDGEQMVKECTKTTHSHDAKDSNYANAVDGLNAVLSAVQKARPNTSWENCADGGTMMTFNMVKQYVTSITNDASSDFGARQATYGATYVFPPRYIDRYMGNQDLDNYTTRSFMFGGPWVFMNRLTELAPEDQVLAASEIATYKTVRANVRDAKVFHLDAPAKEGIDAIQSYNAATRTALAVVTRNGGAESSYALLFRGLEPESSYRVTFQNNSRVLVLSGLQLMRSGVAVFLPEIQSSDIVFATPLQ
ncbi:MAG: glycoside hydrolase family 36 protein [Bryobacteraceae bacterium]